ncbi:hypothetical protein [Aeromonas caviae]|uniref:hypothetical protein n=1 Tax=Aeromonas caviae TaxID=648 RepID=UPI001F2AFB03|nr:hypothetical protein [Aeromonas caviae]
MHHTERLKACLQRVICDPAFPLAELDAWFTPDYGQEVNGERLDYPAFHQHIATLRRHLAGASIEFVATLAQGSGCTRPMWYGPPARTAAPWSAR